MHSLESFAFIAAAAFALACLVVGSSASRIIPVESPAARMEMVEGAP